MLRISGRTPSRSRRRLGALLGASALAASLVPALALTTAAAPAAGSDRSDGLWREASAARAAAPDGRQRRVEPRRFAAYTLDGAALRRRLGGAPDEGARGAAPASLALPAPSGELVDFEVVSSPVMEPGLAAAHPEITTYAGRSSDGTATMRLDVTPMGLHASVRGAGGSWYIDPAYHDDDSLYLSYLGTDLPAEQRSLVEPELSDSELAAMAGPEAGPDADLAPRVGEAPGAPVIRREYRLALITDQSYARYFGTQNVLAEKVTLMNRVNQIYNDDLAIRMLLIDDTDKLNLDTDEKAFGAQGPCGSEGCYVGPNQLANGCTGGLLNRTRIALGQLVGADRFDIGHIMLGINGGGIAALGVVGGNNKAQGCTGLPQPEGDFMAIDYVAHEMGHQFAGNHTFNGTQLNCSGGNRNPGTSVEPGSGSSVMAYAGICRQDDLQPHTDPYFSQRTQTEVSAYVTAQRNAINEVQTVSLYAFDRNDSFTLTYGGRTSAPIVRGSSYTFAGIEAAVLAILPSGSRVTVEPFAERGQALTDGGFQLTFDGPRSPLRRTDVATLALSPVRGDVTGFVGVTANGGPVQNGGSSTVTPGNTAPIAEAPATATIPVRTPFTLTGTALDGEGDEIVYLWEQNDRGSADGTALVSQKKVDGPLFRVFGKYADVTPAGTLQIDSPGENLADGNPSRTFPDLDQILANNTNAATGLCPVPPDAPLTGGSNVPLATRECFSEWLPTADYVGAEEAGNTQPSLNFRLTARDLDPDAGGYSYDDTQLLVDPAAGPFLVSSKNTPAAAVAGRTEVVSWAVAGTDTRSLARNVRISLSVDGGQTYPVVLAESTANDGAEPVTWPDLATTSARIKIEAVGNYFFDVNNADFEIIQPTGGSGGTGGSTGAGAGIADTVAPDTVLTSGPAEGALVLDPQVALGYASTEPAAGFRCTLDAAPLACGTSLTLPLSAVGQTHVVTVAAVDAAGNVDASPARRTFTVPVDDAALKNKKKAWRARDAQAAYLGGYRVARSTGATLQHRVTGATSLALVVGKGRKLGAVKVFLDDTRVARVSLAGPRASGQVVPVATFATPRSGTVRIVTTGDKQVRIDALGVITTR